MAAYGREPSAAWAGIAQARSWRVPYNAVLKIVPIVARGRTRPQQKPHDRLRSNRPSDSAGMTVVDEVRAVVHEGSGQATGECRGLAARNQMSRSPNDIVRGTSSVDPPFGGENANDVLLGFAGADCLECRPSKDTLRGQAGMVKVDAEDLGQVALAASGLK